MPAESKQFAAFVSHNFADQSLAIEFNDALASAGVRTFLAQDELHRNPGEEVHDACYRALAASSAMVVCFGPHGIGNSQLYEIKTAYQLESEGGLAVIVVLLGSAGHGDIPKDQPHLRSKLSFAFPDRAGSPGADELARSLLQCQARAAAATAAAAPPAAATDSAAQGEVDARFDRDADGIAEDLAKSIADYGLSIFVGSIWPERSQTAVFNPNEVAASLLGDLGIPVPDANHVMCFDRAALCYTIARGRGRPGQRQAEDDIITRISRKFSLIPPPVYGRLPALAQKLLGEPGAGSGDSLSDRTPLLLATTNVDRHIERCMVRECVPFVRLAPRRDGSFEQSCFERIERLQDGRIRIVTRLAEGEDGGREVATETQPFDREALRRGGEVNDIFRAREAVLGEASTQQQVWDDLQVDIAIIRHSREVMCSAKPPSGDVRRLERQRADCVRRGVPILFKAFGCVDSSESRALGISSLLQYSRNRNWIPQDVLTWFGATSSLFLGYGLADVRFVHLYEQILAPAFEAQANRMRVLVCPTRTGPDDCLREIDTVLMSVLHNAPDDRFAGIVAVDDAPTRFLARVSERDLSSASLGFL